MGLLDYVKSKLSGKGSSKAKAQLANRVYTLNPFGTDNKSNAEANALYLSCIDSYENTLSKLKPIVKMGGFPKTDMPNLTYLLTMRPNPMQNANSFWRQVAQSYYGENLAVIWIDRDYSELNPDRQVKNLWLVDTSMANFQVGATDSEKSYATTNQEIFSFRIGNKEIACGADDLIILARRPKVDNQYARSNEALNKLIDLIDKNFTGLKNTIANANVIRFIAVSPRVMSPADLKTRQDALNEVIKGVDSEGALYLDSAQSITQLNSGYGWTHTESIKDFMDWIYNYFQVPPEIVQGKATDDVYNMWIESAVSSFTEEASTELTIKLLPKGAVLRGRRIDIDCAQFFKCSQAHQTAKGTMLISSGVYYPNEIRELTGLPLLSDEDNIKVNRIDRVDVTAQEDGDDNSGDNDNADTDDGGGDDKKDDSNEGEGKTPPKKGDDSKDGNQEQDNQ